MSNKLITSKIKELNKAKGHTEKSGKRFKAIYNMNRKYSLLFGADVLMEFPTEETLLTHLDGLISEGE